MFLAKIDRLARKLICRRKVPEIRVLLMQESGFLDFGRTQSGIKCVIVASAMTAEQGPCEPIKGCKREIGEQ